MSEKKIYNVQSGQSFVDVLAVYFLQKYQNCPQDLANVLILLPNRRACQNLCDAFVRNHDLSPTILPRIEPIADVEEDEIILVNHNELPDLPPPAEMMERTLLLTRLIMEKPELGLDKISAAQAFSLAQNLAQLLDLVQNEELDFSRLDNLVPDEYAVHWQQTLKLLRIIVCYWPHILQERGKSDVTMRRNQLLQAQIAIWEKNQTVQNVVVAGSTAAFPLWKKMLKTVMNLPNGEVFLYGLDRHLTAEEWQKIDENHPQFELKELLEYLQKKREEVIDLNPQYPDLRENLVSEIMRPAETSAAWRNLSADTIPAFSWNGIKLLNCDDVRTEAKAIALIIRETLEHKEKTAALITADRNLARRVSSELKKWDIIADDSAGQPLHLTPIGIFLRLISAAVEKDSQAAYMALLKHPFTNCGYAARDFNMLCKHLELVWRGHENMTAELECFWQKVRAKIQPLADLYAQPYNNLAELFKTHIKVAESLADTDEKSGDKIIWRKNDGETAAQFVGDFCKQCAIIGTICSKDYAALVNTIMASYNVRIRYGMHPRVKILGPIEARLVQYDVTIIGEANEGIWPQIPSADMWLSRPMKKDFGLPVPERYIGVMAADFAHLLNAPQVYITRAERMDGTPTNKSRWWLRLETVLNACFKNKDEESFVYDVDFVNWSKAVDCAQKNTPILPPAPRPAVNMRPRRLSASNIETLLRDPYSIFAKYILKLMPLDDLDQDLQAKDFGNIVHEILENFNNKYNEQLPENARDILLQYGKNFFDGENISLQLKAFWWPKFVKMADWLLEIENLYRPAMARVHTETNGKIIFSAPAGEFVVTAKADRVDEGKDGKIRIIDYKTGRARSKKEIISGKAPQLPIEGLIAQKGGFAEVGAAKVASMRYWRFKDKEEICADDEAQKAIANIEEVVQNLINEFDNVKRPYLAKPVASRAPEYNDYDHLSRYLEWSVKDDFDGENGND